jgi:hypothetical protein
LERYDWSSRVAFLVLADIIAALIVVWAIFL